MFTQLLSSELVLPERAGKSQCSFLHFLLLAESNQDIPLLTEKGTKRCLLKGEVVQNLGISIYQTKVFCPCSITRVMCSSVRVISKQLDFWDSCEGLAHTVSACFHHLNGCPSVPPLLNYSNSRCSFLKGNIRCRFKHLERIAPTGKFFS